MIIVFRNNMCDHILDLEGFDCTMHVMRSFDSDLNHALFDMFDADNSGMIDLDEFLLLCCFLQSPDNSSKMEIVRGSLRSPEDLLNLMITGDLLLANIPADSFPAFGVNNAQNFQMYLLNISQLLNLMMETSKMWNQNKISDSNVQSFELLLDHLDINVSKDAAHAFSLILGDPCMRSVAAIAAYVAKKYHRLYLTRALLSVASGEDPEIAPSIENALPRLKVFSLTGFIFLVSQITFMSTGLAASRILGALMPTLIDEGKANPSALTMLSFTDHASFLSAGIANIVFHRAGINIPWWFHTMIVTPVLGFLIVTLNPGSNIHTIVMLSVFRFISLFSDKDSSFALLTSFTNTGHALGVMFMANAIQALLISSIVTELGRSGSKVLIVLFSIAHACSLLVVIRMRRLGYGLSGDHKSKQKSGFAKGKWSDVPWRNQLICLVACHAFNPGTWKWTLVATLTGENSSLPIGTIYILFDVASLLSIPLTTLMMRFLNKRLNVFVMFMSLCSFTAILGIFIRKESILGFMTCVVVQGFVYTPLRMLTNEMSVFGVHPNTIKLIVIATFLGEAVGGTFLAGGIQLLLTFTDNDWPVVMWFVAIYEFFALALQRRYQKNYHSMALIVRK